MFNFLSLVVVAVAAATASAQTYTGGEATYYFQNGVAGACGQVNPDSALIVAVQAQRFNTGLCGRQVQVTNTNNGESVVATVADECPGCQGNPNSLDLSEGAFEQIADLSAGVVPITYTYL
ncbi:hypothetical protein PENSPDRAFT_683380 [Peniophora sp. CONT]|nr:hypothetical protein PENSPDRAFT_683380 [Peniophora sp. CONT]